VEDLQKGRVKFFNSRKGFGFIAPDDGSRDVFVSVNVLPRGTSLVPDQRVSYRLATGKKGPNAKDVVAL
jgi:cold shock protein